MPLGVQKKMKPTKQNKKKFLNNVLDYLKSDFYMFAPLISPPLAVKMNEPIKGNKKRVLMKVSDYIKSDTYMYAPLVSSRLLGSPPSGKIHCIRKVNMDVSIRMLNLEENNQSTESANVTSEKQPCKNCGPGISTVDNQTLGRGEMLKHMVSQHCRSSSVSIRYILHHMKRFLAVPFLFLYYLASSPGDMPSGPFFWMTRLHYCHVK